MQQPAHQEKPTKHKPVTENRTGAGADDLRSTLEWLRAQGDRIETEKQVDPDLEVTGLQKHMDGGCPVMFQNVKGKPNHRVITNLFGDQNVTKRLGGGERDVAPPPRYGGGVRKAAQAGDHFSS